MVIEAFNNINQHKIYINKLDHLIQGTKYHLCDKFNNYICYGAAKTWLKIKRKTIEEIKNSIVLIKPNTLFNLTLGFFKNNTNSRLAIDKLPDEVKNELEHATTESTQRAVLADVISMSK